MSDKVKISEIASELGLTSKEVLEKATSLSILAKAASSSVSMEDAGKIMDFVMGKAPAAVKPKPKVIKKKVVAKVEEPAKEETNVEISSPAVEDKTPAPTQEKKVEELVNTEATIKTEEVKTEEAKSDETPKTVVKPVRKSAASNLKEVIPEKRTRLKIKKKKKPKVEEIYTMPSDSALKGVSNYGKLSSDALRELNERKAKRAQNGPARKQDSGRRMDIFNNDMADVSMDFEDQVVLLDLNDLDKKPEPVEQKPQQKRERPAGRNGGKKKTSFRPRQVKRGRRTKYAKESKVDEIITHVEIPEDIRVYEFAEKLNRPISDVIKVLFNLGMMATKNDFLGKDEIEILSEEFEVEVTTIDPKDEFDYEDHHDNEDMDENLIERPAVITIMGHVDHGKTSLLDAIRDAKVADGEAGGITQHIGAYTVVQNNHKITFIDTPGHAAFGAMRERGADATDIIIIVVAADDGVKPQTIEAIKIAKKSGAPVIVAVNKMDKEGANPDLLKGQMAEHEMTPVDWGGDVEFIEVSAKTGKGLDTLLDTILITSEVLELKANPDAVAKAIVVESSIEKGRGPVATVIVQNGTLRVGDTVVCGSSHGRVKALIDNHKKMIKTITLSESAVVVGLNEVPASGETLMQMNSDKEAREYAQKRYEYERNKELSKSTKTSLDELSALIAEGKLKSLKIVLKADVHGSLEAVTTSLTELRNDEVKVEVISSGVGGITESDVELVNNSENTMLLGFNVRPTGAVKASAKQKGVEIHTYSIIYQLLDDVTSMLTGMMETKFTEENTGQADVKEVFSIPKGTVAGCMVVDGKLIRGEHVRVIREGVVIFEGELNSLKRFKDDVKEVGNGYECGVVLNGYTDVVVGDVIETFKKVEVKTQL